MFCDNRKNRKALTLTELLIALTVSSVVLAAVAALAYAMGSAQSLSDDTAAVQSRLRFTTARLNELVKNSRLICYAGSEYAVVWKADTNGDNQINPAEIAYIDSGSEKDYLKIIEFTPSKSLEDYNITIKKTTKNWFKKYLEKKCKVSSIPLLANCADVSFSVDSKTPFSKCLSVSFDLIQNGSARTYQINCAKLANAENLLTSKGKITKSGDDD